MGFTLLSTSALQINIGYNVSNPSNRDLILEKADGIVKKDGVEFALLTLIEADTVKAAAQQHYSATFKLELLDPLSLLSMGLDPSKWQIEEFRVDASSFIKSSSGVRKCIKFKELPLNSIIKKFN